MKKLLALACATSALALTTGATADTYTMSIQGIIAPVCSITAVLGGMGNSNGTLNGGQTSFVAPNAVDGSGHLVDNRGGFTLSINATGGCHYNITPSRGYLAGTTSTQHIPYLAGLVAGSEISASNLVNASALPYAAPISIGTAGTQYVTAAFNVQADLTTVYAPDTYTDTLRIDVLPGA